MAKKIVAGTDVAVKVEDVKVEETEMSMEDWDAMRAAGGSIYLAPGIEGNTDEVDGNKLDIAVAVEQQTWDRNGGSNDTMFSLAGINDRDKMFRLFFAMLTQLKRHYFNGGNSVFTLRLASPEEWEEDKKRQFEAWKNHQQERRYQTGRKSNPFRKVRN